MYHRCNWNSKKVFFKKKTKGTFSWQNQRWAHIQIRGKKKYREGWKLVLCSVALNEKVEVMVSSFASFTSGWRCLTWVVQIVETGCMLLPLLSQVRRVRLCEPIVGSPPGSLVPGIFQARVLEWGVIAFSMPCLTQWNYEPCLIWPPKTDVSWWSVLTKRGPLEKAMANHFSILALRTPRTVWKGKKIGHWKRHSPGR